MVGFEEKIQDVALVTTAERVSALLEAKVLAEDFRIDYNTYRPHSSLKYRTPASFAAEWARQTAGIT